MGSDKQPSSMGSHEQKKDYEEFDDELEKEVQRRQLSSYDVCLERRATLEKKIGGDIQVKLMEADTFKKIHFLEQVFHEFDDDKSGEIDMHEFFVALRTCGFQVSMPAALSIMKEVDADETGTIDVDEFIEFFKKMEDLEAFRYKVETAQHASGPRGMLISVYVFVLAMGCFALILLDIESGGENATIKLLLIFMVVVFLISISAVLFLPLLTMKFRPGEKMADLKNHLGGLRRKKKRNAPKRVEETLVEAVDIPAPAPKSSAVEASRLKHPHLYAASNPFAVEAAPSEASTEASRSVPHSSQSHRSRSNSVCSGPQGYRKGSTQSHRSRSNSACSGSDVQGPRWGKEVWESPAVPDIEQGKLISSSHPAVAGRDLKFLTGLVDQAQGGSRSPQYAVSQYDKARELQARHLEVNMEGVPTNTNFTPFLQSQHRPRQLENSKATAPR